MSANARADVRLTARIRAIHEYSHGTLFVNGQPVMHAGKLTGQAPGRVLLHTPPAGSCQ
jgi:hypothetical protein